MPLIFVFLWTACHLLECGRVDGKQLICTDRQGLLSDAVTIMQKMSGCKVCVCEKTTRTLMGAEDSLIEIVTREVKGCMDSEHLGSIGGLRSYNDPNSAEQKCFLGCMLKKFKALDADGQYSAEGLKTTIQHCPRMKSHPDIQKAALQVADECNGKVTGCSDYCSCAPLAAKCLHEGMKNKSFQTIFIALDEALDKMQS